MDSHQPGSSSSSYVYQPPLRPFEVKLLEDADIEFVEDYMSNRGVTQSSSAFKPFSSSFVDITSVDFYKVNLARTFISEQPINRCSFASNNLLFLLSAVGVISTVTSLCAYTVEVIREFYSNIRLSITDPSSPMYHRVYLRKHFYEFSPKVINKYFGFPEECQYDEFNEACLDDCARALSGGFFDSWPNESFPSAILDEKFSALFHVAVCNWFPTFNTTEVSPEMGRFLYAIGIGKSINFGSFIFDQIIKCCETYDHSDPIIFPRTIFGIMLDQHNPASIDEKIVIPNDEFHASSNTHQKIFEEDISQDNILYESGFSSIASSFNNGFEIQQIRNILRDDINKAKNLKTIYMEEIVRLDKETTLKNRLMWTLK